MFGLNKESFTGVKQQSGYAVQAGYQKGVDVAAKNLSFLVMAMDGTASKLIMPLKHPIKPQMQ